MEINSHLLAHIKQLALVAVSRESLGIQAATWNWTRGQCYLAWTFLLPSFWQPSCSDLSHSLSSTNATPTFPPSWPLIDENWVRRTLLQVQWRPSVGLALPTWATENLVSPYELSSLITFAGSKASSNKCSQQICFCNIAVRTRPAKTEESSFTDGCCFNVFSFLFLLRVIALL